MKVKYIYNGKIIREDKTKIIPQINSHVIFGTKNILKVKDVIYDFSTATVTVVLST